MNLSEQGASLRGSGLTRSGEGKKKTASCKGGFLLWVMQMVTNVIIHGDCLDVLRELPDNSIDSVVTDPPYGLSKEPNIREVLEKWLVGEDYKHRDGGF